MPGLNFVDFTQNREQARRKVISSMLQLLDKEHRELKDKIEELSDANVHLKEENHLLATECDKRIEQLKAVELFDGNWDVSPRGQVPPFRPLAERKPIVALMNLKGGVGKTTLTANIGATLWREAFRKRVLLLDLDYQASLTKICLDESVLPRLRAGERLVQRFFARNEVLDPGLVLQCAEPIQDRKIKDRKGSGGHIVATNENLAAIEVLSQGEWLVGKRELDVRYVLRKLLHAEMVRREYDFILLDCPPRLTTCCINALTCCDYLLIPVTLEDIATEGVPRLLNWVRKRKEALCPGLSGVGVVANRTRGVKLTLREDRLWTKDLQKKCEDAWGAPVPLFQKVLPTFVEPAMDAAPFPAGHASLRDIFQSWVEELTGQLKIKQEVTV
jgi:cellulose biosynthesis protein BcsQ